MPPHGELAPPAPHHGYVDREHEKPERDHPEAEHGQEAEQPARHQQDAEPVEYGQVLIVIDPNADAPRCLQTDALQVER